MFKSFLRRLVRPFATFHTYTFGSDVGGWAGWYELAGRVVAFKDRAGCVSYRW